MQEALADLMSQSTISGQHPGKPYAPVDMLRANRSCPGAGLLRATSADEKRVLNQQIKETGSLSTTKPAASGSGL